MKNLAFYSICYPLLTAVLFSCKGDEAPVEVTDRSDRDTHEEPKHPYLPTGMAPMDVTTALTVLPFDDYEEPFFLDHLREYDTAVYSAEPSMPAVSDVYAQFPQSKAPEHKKWNAAVRNLATQFIKEYQLEDTVDFLNLSAAFWIDNFEVKGNIVQCTFLAQSYAHGAAHYVHWYQTLNYDMEKQWPIGLTDLLQFKNEDEKQKFCDAFNPDPSVETADVVLTPGEFTAEQDFTITDDGIYLLFDDYQKGPSIKMFFIPYAKIRGYVNPDYAALFDL